MHANARLVYGLVYGAIELAAMSILAFGQPQKIGDGTPFLTSRSGEGGGTRTHDSRIKSPLLYQLSYAPSVLRGA
jgi:hypothetical protein